MKIQDGNEKNNMILDEENESEIQESSHERLNYTEDSDFEQ